MPCTYSTIWIVGPSEDGAVNKSIERARNFLEKHLIPENEGSKGSDKSLFDLSHSYPDDPDPLLCLRCRVSHSVFFKIRELCEKYKSRYKLELPDMAACVLDDDGGVNLRLKKQSDEGINQTFSKRLDILH